MKAAFISIHCFRHLMCEGQRWLSKYLTVPSVLSILHPIQEPTFNFFTKLQPVLVKVIVFLLPKIYNVLGFDT